MPLIIHKIPIAHALGKANYNTNKLNVLTHQYNNILSTKQRCAMYTQNIIIVKPKTVNKNQRQEEPNAGNSINGIRNHTYEMHREVCSLWSQDTRVLLQQTKSRKIRKQAQTTLFWRTNSIRVARNSRSLSHKAVSTHVGKVGHWWSSH